METGLHQNYFRDYEPLIGRYIQRDPIGLADGTNTFAYAGSNPINYWDFDGKKMIKCDPRLFAILRTAVLVSCKGEKDGKKTKCDRNDSCNRLRLKVAVKGLCIAAQSTLSFKCYKENPSHDQRIKDEINGINKCTDYMKEACKDDCEEKKPTK